MAKNETELEKEDEALQNTEQIYDQLVSAADSTYKAQIDAANAFEKEQLKAMDQQTDFAIEEIRQNKAEAEKDYNREQAAAYADYKKQTDPYGVNAEHMASAGLSGSGYSESSKVAMYNAMQNRIASARDSIARVTANYNMAITEARAQNNVAKAKLAYETLVKTLELSLNGLQYKTNLTLEKQSAQEQTNYLDVLNQLNGGDDELYPKPSNEGAVGLWDIIRGKIEEKKGESVPEVTDDTTIDMDSANAVLNAHFSNPAFDARIQNEIKNMTDEQKAVVLMNLVNSGVVEQYLNGDTIMFRLNLPGKEYKQG